MTGALVKRGSLNADTEAHVKVKGDVATSQDRQPTA